MNKQNIIILVVTIIVLGFAFNYLLNSKETATSSSLSLVTSSAEDINAKEILKLLGKMTLVKLDDGIFKSPVFLYLKDTSVTLVSQPVGRLNPFSPINQSETYSIVSSSTKK